MAKPAPDFKIEPSTATVDVRSKHITFLKNDQNHWALT